MTNLVWILESNISQSLGTKGVSSSYIIPKNNLPADLGSITGKRLWIVLREDEDRLLITLKIKKIERIIGGYYDNDYIISVDVSESFKLVKSYIDAAKYKTTITKGLPLGVSKISSESNDILVQTVKNSIQINFNTPPEKIISAIPVPLIPNNPDKLAKSILAAITTRLTLEDVWGNTTVNKLGPFSNFAYSLVSKKFSPKKNSMLIDALNIAEPSHFNISRIEPTQKEKSEIIKLPHVDIIFSEIEPKNICARKFLHMAPEDKDIEDILQKTEHAEQVHQDMLKDISQYLIDSHLTPYESNSIDLAYMIGEMLNIIEIKSATSKNIFSQCEKGAFQLACYLNEINKNYSQVKSFLIIHEIGIHDIEVYVAIVLESLGIKCLFYRPDRSWPERVEGLLL